MRVDAKRIPNLFFLTEFRFWNILQKQMLWFREYFFVWLDRVSLEKAYIVFAVKCNCLIFKSARVGALSAREKCPNSNCCMFISSIAFTWMVRRSWIFFLKLSVHYAQYKRCANVVRTAYIYEIHNYTILTNIESVCYVSGGLCRKYIFMFIGNKFPNTSCHTVGDGKSLR